MKMINILEKKPAYYNLKIFIFNKHNRYNMCKFIIGWLQENPSHITIKFNETDDDYTTGDFVISEKLRYSGYVIDYIAQDESNFMVTPLELLSHWCDLPDIPDE